ncbi:MAG: BMP family ABC transporter substrate-binding protein [Acidimicrobiia bacterium]|nr:BMP family ABC transporter substrate-binding protein [Acidimicrobiia bacterium]
MLSGLRKKGALLALLFAFALVAAACGDDDGTTTTAGGGDTPATTAAPQASICEVTDVGGVDDKGFNASAWAGAQRAAADFGAEAEVLESQAETDYEVNLNSFIDAGCDLIVTVGFLLGDATLAAAQSAPDTPFTIVDFAYGDETPPNLKGLVFNTDEAAFLAGYLAAGMTQTGKVGTFGGINIPPVTIFMDGFARGVAHYNSENGASIEVLGWDPDTQEGSFTNNFESLDDGRAFAQSLVDEGADIVMPVAGPVGLGSASLASELGTFSIIGVDVDGYDADPNNSGVYLTSVLKRIDNAVYAAADEAINGTFTSDLYVGSLENQGVGIAPFHDFNSQVPQELKDQLAALEAAIIDGSVSVGG